MATNSQRNISNENIYFKSSEEMYSKFEDIPEIIQNNLNISLSTWPFISKIKQLRDVDNFSSKSEKPIKGGFSVIVGFEGIKS